MIGKKYLIPIFLFLCTLSSCNTEPKLDYELMVGTVRTLDQNLPFPFLLEKTANGLNLINYKNQLIDSTRTPQFNYEPMDTIKMQNHQFLVVKSTPNLWLLNIRDSINFPYQHPLYAAQFFETVQPEETIHLSSFLNNLQGKTYLTEVESAHFATPNRDLKVLKEMSFSKDSLQTIFTYFYQDEPVYSEKEVSKFHIFERKGKVFFTKDQKADNPETLYQIMNIDTYSFTLRTFRSTDEIIERLEIIGKTENAPEVVNFKRCQEGQPGEYYHDNLTYLKGNEYLVKKIGENTPQASGDGYITVHFTLNCRGEMGNLGLEQMDLKFNSTSFNPAFVKHIIKEVMDLKEWPEIKHGWFYKDIHSFLMFRIKNGKIADLCP